MILVPEQEPCLIKVLGLGFGCSSNLGASRETLTGALVGLKGSSWGLPKYKGVYWIRELSRGVS